MTVFPKLQARRFVRLLTGCALIAMTAGSVHAAEPTGHWMVADGNARIKIGPCGEVYWGLIDWAGRPDDIDQYNPDPLKRNRSVIGMPILLAMKPSGPNEWSGEVYNAQNGNTYKAKITLLEQDVLKITGCVLGGLFCGGEKWTRAKENEMMTVPPGAAPKNGQSNSAPPRAQTNAMQNRAPTNAAPTRAPANAAQNRAQPARPDGEVCPDRS